MPQYKRSTTPKWRFAGVMTERRESEEPKAHVFRSEKSRQAVWIDAEEGCTGRGREAAAPDGSVLCIRILGRESDLGPCVAQSCAATDRSDAAD
jgi:hypothetical protein